MVAHAETLYQLGASSFQRRGRPVCCADCLVREILARADVCGRAEGVLQGTARGEEQSDVLQTAAKPFLAGT